MKIIHLSDLHFSAGYARGESHRHDLDLLAALSRCVSEQGPVSKVIVSGDLSDSGDLQSLTNARNFLLRTLQISPNEEVGLSLGKLGCGEAVNVVAGNHDAHNAGQGSGKAKLIWQKSTENFYRVFPECQHQFATCDYEWIDQGEWGVFIVYADTCFLGDPADSRNPRRVYITDRVAVGKLAIEKSAEIMKVFHRGMDGKLIDPSSRATKEEDKYIPAAKFAKSFKIFVTHHYLFESSNKTDFFHRILSRDRVFQNIAMSDFDVLLCGHKHEAFLKSVCYSDYFDARAIGRYGLNYLRLVLGLAPLPVQERVEGRLFSKIVTIMAQLARLKIKGESDPNMNVVSGVSRKMTEWIENPNLLKNHISDILNEGPPVDYSKDEYEHEMKEILSHFRDFHNGSEARRREVSLRLKQVSRSLVDFKNRQFVQAMCGSSCKQSAGNKDRFFYVYHLERSANEYVFKSQKFVAMKRDGAVSFEPSSEQLQGFKFPHDRVYAAPDSLFHSRIHLTKPNSLIEPMGEDGALHKIG